MKTGLSLVAVFCVVWAAPAIADDAARFEGIGYTQSVLRPMVVIGLIFVGGLSVLFFSATGLIHGLRRRRFRMHKRYPCSGAIWLEHRGEAVPARLVDAARKGARIRCVGKYTTGQKLKIGWHDEVIAAHVVWSGESYIGVQFTEMLGARRLVQLLRRSRNADDYHELQPAPF